MNKTQIVKLLNEGRVIQWNKYREEHPDWVPDLRGQKLESSSFARGLEDAFAPAHFNLTNGIYDINTQFQPHFDPEKYGLIYKEQEKDRDTPNSQTEGYSFKKFELLEPERIWLSELYKVDFHDVDFKVLKVKLRDKLTKDFELQQLTDKGLIYDQHLTLLGIWYIDSKSKYLQTVERVILSLRDLLFVNPKLKKISAKEIADKANLDQSVIEISLMLILDLGGFFGSASATKESLGFTDVGIADGANSLDKFIHFRNIEDELERYYLQARVHYQPSMTINKSSNRSVKEDIIEQQSLKTLNKQIWKLIQNDYDVNKQSFGKKINFVSDKYVRSIIFRDIEHAYILARNGFSKPAVILAGSVIEELLRLYLRSKNVKPVKKSFEEYIKACEDHGLLKLAISRLSDSVRYFRNLVHMAREKDRKHTISKATAKGAVSSIFVIVNDF